MNKLLYYGFNYILCYSVLGYSQVITKFFISEQDAMDYLALVENVTSYKIYKADGGNKNV